jgi:hypothetical protein
MKFSASFALLLAAASQALAQQLAPQATYDGGYSDAKDIRLRIGNGGAGQSGLIGTWADAFVQYCVKEKNMEPFKVLLVLPVSANFVAQACAFFQVGWYLGDTTQSLTFLQEGSIDVAVTYNEAAENQALNTKSAVQRVYGFRVGSGGSLSRAHTNINSLFLGPLLVRWPSIQPGEHRRRQR